MSYLCIVKNKQIKIMAKSFKKQFGKYEVKFDSKTNIYAISYVWSARDKELFKEVKTAVETLTWLREYLTRTSEAYAQAKAFFMPLIEEEF